jgi:hypothetical protein
MTRPLKRLIRSLTAKRLKAVVKGRGHTAYQFKKRAEAIKALIREVK